MRTKDWDALTRQMQNILATEDELAEFIGQQFQQQVSDARNAGQDTKRPQSIREALATFGAALESEWKAIVPQEIDLYSMV